MIAGLRGRVAFLQPVLLHLDTGNVIYELHIPLSVFEKLQSHNLQEEVLFYIYHQFLQDGEERLFGFLDAGQRQVFGALQSIKGLGTSLALSLLSHLDGRTLFDICEKGDIASLTRIPRIGKSTAETIIFEVGRKREKWRGLLAVSSGEDEMDPENLLETDREAALAALVQLGYKESQAAQALGKVAKKVSAQAPASDWIREALMHL